MADCASKELAETYLAPERTPHEVIGSVLRLTLAHNAGGAMGLSLGPYSRIGLALAALLAVFVLGQLYVRTPATPRLRAAELAPAVGGSMGNLGSPLASQRGVTELLAVGAVARR